MRKNATRRRHQDRVLKIALALTGLLFCSHVLIDRPAADSSHSWNAALDRIKIRSSDGFEILSDHPTPRDVLFKGKDTEEWSENKHVWAHYQLLVYRKATGAVRYYDFRSDEEARLARERFVKECIYKSFIPSPEARVFGSFVVLVHTARTNFPAFSDAVFTTLQSRIETTGDVNGRPS